ncbi:MAG: hypothetical protein LC720_01225, partial [Actinobacteria bacterium]|nr:hypothetical protein [Actinomycetota bacterium]
MLDLGSFPALETAIGLAAVYFLLSTVCSSINESIAAVLGWRAKTLEDAIHNFLGDPKVKRGWKEWFGRVSPEPHPDDLTHKVFNHSHLRAMVRDPDSKLRRRARPSYLPPKAFSLALTETLVAGAPAAPGISLWEEGDEEFLHHVGEAIDKLPPGQGHDTLKRALMRSGGTVEGFRVNVEHGFDD